MGGDQDQSVDRPGQPKANFWQNSKRTVEFWRRCGGVYLAYKAAQAKQIYLKRRGWTPEKLQERLWRPHHAWAGREMHAICVDLRGFYLKVRPCLRAAIHPERMQPANVCIWHSHMIHQCLSLSMLRQWHCQCVLSNKDKELETLVMT